MALLLITLVPAQAQLTVGHANRGTASALF
jgi:hypothetical protein